MSVAICWRSVAVIWVSDCHRYAVVERAIVLHDLVDLDVARRHDDGAGMGPRLRLAQPECWCCHWRWRADPKWANRCRCRRLRRRRWPCRRLPLRRSPPVLLPPLAAPPVAVPPAGPPPMLAPPVAVPPAALPPVAIAVPPVAAPPVRKPPVFATVPPLLGKAPPVAARPPVPAALPPVPVVPPVSVSIGVSVPLQPRKRGATRRNASSCNRISNLRVERNAEGARLVSAGPVPICRRTRPCEAGKRLVVLPAGRRTGEGAARVRSGTALIGELPVVC